MNHPTIETCGNCRSFTEKPRPNTTAGWCCHNPPTRLEPSQSGEARAAWPTVNPGDWCRQWENSTGTVPWHAPIPAENLLSHAADPLASASFPIVAGMPESPAAKTTTDLPEPPPPKTTHKK